MVDVAAAEIERVHCRAEAVRRFAYHSALSSASVETPSAKKSDWLSIRYGVDNTTSAQAAVNYAPGNCYVM